MHKQQTELSSIKIMTGAISPLLRYKQAKDTNAVSSVILPTEGKLYNTT